MHNKFNKIKKFKIILKNNNIRKNRDMLLKQHGENKSVFFKKKPLTKFTPNTGALVNISLLPLFTLAFFKHSRFSYKKPTESFLNFIDNSIHTRLLDLLSLFRINRFFSTNSLLNSRELSFFYKINFYSNFIFFNPLGLKTSLNLLPKISLLRTYFKNFRTTNNGANRMCAPIIKKTVASPLNTPLLSKLPLLLKFKTRLLLLKNPNRFNKFNSLLVKKNKQLNAPKTIFFQALSFFQAADPSFVPSHPTNNSVFEFDRADFFNTNTCQYSNMDLNWNGLDLPLYFIKNLRYYPLGKKNLNLSAVVLTYNDDLIPNKLSILSDKATLLRSVNFNKNYFLMKASAVSSAHKNPLSRDNKWPAHLFGNTWKTDEKAHRTSVDYSQVLPRYSRFSFKLNYLFYAFTFPLILKHTLYLIQKNTSHVFNFPNQIFNQIASVFKKNSLYSGFSKLGLSNIIPSSNFSYQIQKRVLKVSTYTRFIPRLGVWHLNTLIRFLEYCSGKRVLTRFHPFLSNSLDFFEKARCGVWAQKVKTFRRLIGPRLFLIESLEILYIALKLKDPYFLANWMAIMMQKISFWKLKTFLRYLKYVLRYFFWAVFDELNIRGIKYQLKGKVSVAGNARTRRVFHKIGRTSHATVDNKVLQTLVLVRTFTGVMGLKVWLFF